MRVGVAAKHAEASSAAIAHAPDVEDLELLLDAPGAAPPADRHDQPVAVGLEAKRFEANGVESGTRAEPSDVGVETGDDARGELAVALQARGAVDPEFDERAWP